MAFVIDPSKPAAEELKRIAGEQLRSALDALEKPEGKGLEAAVHSVRKSCKRVRSLARIARPALGSEYRRTNIAVRDASAALSPLRDAHAVLATFDSFVAARPDLVPAHGFGELRGALADRASGASDPAATSERLSEAAVLLRATADRFARRRLELDLRDLATGAAEYHAHARRAFRRSLDDPSDEALHEWRKRVKDGWYHTQLLMPLAPSMLAPAEASLSDLSDALGDNNDLAVLSHLLQGSPDEFGPQQATDALEGIGIVRHELLRRARSLAARVYAEAAPEYRTRLRGYVKATRTFGPEQPVRGIGGLFGGAAAR